MIKGEHIVIYVCIYLVLMQCHSLWNYFLGALAWIWSCLMSLHQCRLLTIPAGAHCGHISFKRTGPSVSLARGGHHGQQLAQWIFWTAVSQHLCWNNLWLCFSRARQYILSRSVSAGLSLTLSVWDPRCRFMIGVQQKTRDPVFSLPNSSVCSISTPEEKKHLWEQ